MFLCLCYLKMKSIEMNKSSFDIWVFIFTFRVRSYASDSDDSENEVELDIEKLPPLEVGPGEHKLQFNYCLWYHRGSMTKFKSPSVRDPSQKAHVTTNYPCLTLTCYYYYCSLFSMCCRITVNRYTLWDDVPV